MTDTGGDFRERIALASARIPFQVKVGAVWAVLFALLGLLFYFADYDVEWMRENFTFILRGLQFTLLMALGGIVLATILATLGALARLSKNPILYGVSGFYVSFFRGTPLIVQMFLVYLALPQIGGNLVDRYPGLGTNFQQALILEAATAGTIALGLNYGAYMTEIFRAGIQSVAHGQGEAADALGMTVRRQDAPRRTPPGDAGDHPAHRQRVHRDDEGHRPRLLPRRGGGERRDVPAQPARRQGGLQEPRGLRAGGAVLLGADGDLHVLPEPVGGPDGDRLRPGVAFDPQSGRSAAARWRGAVMTEDDVIVRVSGLQKSYGEHVVLRDVDLELHRGEVIVIFGRSGSGKSTLLRCVNFLEDPTGGTIEIAGQTLTGGHRTRRKREQIRRVRLHAGMVFQQFYLFPHLTTLENVMSGPLALGRETAGSSPRPSTARSTSGVAATGPPSSSGPWTCSTRSAWPTRPTSTRSGCPAASSSGSPSPGPWPCSRR